MDNKSKRENYSQNTESKREEYLETIKYIEKDMYDCIELMIRKLRNATRAYEDQSTVKLRKEMFSMMTDMTRKFDKILSELTQGQGQTNSYIQGKLF